MPKIDEIILPPHPPEDWSLPPGCGFGFGFGFGFGLTVGSSPDGTSSFAETVNVNSADDSLPASSVAFILIIYVPSSAVNLLLVKVTVEPSLVTVTETTKLFADVTLSLAV